MDGQYNYNGSLRMQPSHQALGTIPIEVADRLRGRHLTRIDVLRREIKIREGSNFPLPVSYAQGKIDGLVLELSILENKHSG